jgi:sporulation protein YlmC with PRC-barrel domain
MVGKPINSSDGSRVGTIYDIVLTPELDSVSYVVLSRGGLFGFGRQLHAIPWSALQTSFSGEYYVPITAEQLSGTRGFSSNRWPTSPESGWLLGETSGETVYRSGTAEENRMIQNRRVSRIFGISVRNPQGRNVATIRDLVMAADSGQLLYTIVSTGGILGLGSRYAAIPPEAIEFWPDQRVARITVSEDVLRANAFNPNQWPDLADETYARDLREAFQVEPSSVALGYVPPAEEQPSMTTRQAPGREQGTETTSQEAEQQPFPSTEMTHIQGIVTDVGIFRPAEGGPETLRLRLKTDEGKLITVHLAPRDYISRQDFYVVPGDSVTVTGAELRIGQQSIFLAAQVTRDGQTLRLRDANGRPLWLRPGESAESTHERSAETGRTSEHTEQYPETDQTM